MRKKKPSIRVTETGRKKNTKGGHKGKGRGGGERNQVVVEDLIKVGTKNR